MSGEYFDQDEVIAFGQPWHGALRNSTLVTSSGVEMAITVPATSPYTHLVEFPGLPGPVTPPDDLALGREFKNYAILYGRERRYNPKATLFFGRNGHVYLTDDKTHYHISVIAGSISGSIASGASWLMSFTVQARKAANEALGTSQTVIPSQNLSGTGIGGSAGYYGQVATFSPNGKRLCVAVHKYATAEQANLGDVRYSLGCAGIWEVAMSGGSASAIPTAVLSQIKTSADYYTTGDSVAELADVEAYGDLSTLAVSGGQSTDDENGNPLPGAQIRAWETRSVEWKISRELIAVSPQGEPEYWSRTRFSEVILGAAYDSSSSLKVFSFREEVASSNSNSLTGPTGVVTVSFEAILTGAGGTVVRWISKSSDISRNRSLSRSVSRTFSLKMNGVAAVTKTISSSYTLASTTVQSYNDSAEWVSATTSGPTESYSKTIDGSATTLTTLSFKITSNNTAAIVNGLYAYAFCAPSGLVGTAQTLALDSLSLPWAAWNPKTGDLATTPGWSWC